MNPEFQAVPTLVAKTGTVESVEFNVGPTYTPAVFSIHVKFEGETYSRTFLVDGPVTVCGALTWQGGRGAVEWLAKAGTDVRATVHIDEKGRGWGTSVKTDFVEG